jgi:hypothetical protein
MIPTTSHPAKTRRLRQLVWAMVLLLTFEGLARKALPQVGILIFLLKDFLTVWMAFYVLRMPINPIIRSLWYGYLVLIFLMSPLVVLTAVHDPLLGIFGAKLYLLYPMVAFAIFMAFEHSKMEVIFTFYRRVAILLIPTVLLAVLQLRLPNTSWINMSVNGESLSSFGYEGILRVSSTFSFVAQFCAFLNAEMFIVFIALHGWSNQTLRWKILTVALFPAILVGSFITGSRGAVTINLTTMLLAMLLGLLKFRARNVFQIGIFMGVLYLAVVAINHFFPFITMIYFNREGGHLLGFSEEIRQRAYGAFFSLPHEAVYRTFWGIGLGIETNGAEKVSSYAAQWRTRFWTETDFGTTLVEGGVYLAFVWYGFRLFVILKTLSNFLMDITPEYSVLASFCQGFVVVMGLFGTLSLQPPIAIWWWLGVGTLLLFSWKCIAPSDSEEPMEAPKPPMRRKIRGRSLYADVIHSRK